MTEIKEDREKLQNMKINYIHSENLLKQCNKIPVLKSRASMVHELIKSYGLLNCMQIKPSKRATSEELRLFHSSSYVQQLIKYNADESSSSDSETDVTIDDESYGLVYDCPKFKKLFDFASEIAGGTLSAVDAIMSGADVAINWTGGWHHAQTDEAEGFCYVNDIAIGIQKLREQYKKILYIDLDIHHGNGVENAFGRTRNVLTLSFHQSEVGFYPGTGQISHIGEGRGKGFAINAPFRRSITGEKYVNYFKTVVEAVYESFQPEVCVVQCGGDILVGDPLGGANLGLHDMGECVKGILAWTIPKIFVGGGGYNFANTARYWAYLTSVICGQPIAEDIPDNEYFENYGPDFTINVTKTYVRDENTQLEIDENIRIIFEILKQYHNS